MGYIVTFQNMYTTYNGQIRITGISVTLDFTFLCGGITQNPLL
jgi:hypothetical protein